MVSVHASGSGGLLLGIALTLLLAWSFVRIVQKAGYSGWWVVVLVVPFLNLVMLVVFAFSDWPVSRDPQPADSSAT